MEPFRAKHFLPYIDVFHPYLPIIYIKDYSDLFQIIPALSKEMYDSFMSESDCSVMTREYWITKIEALRNSL